MHQKNKNRFPLGILLLAVLAAPQLINADIVFSNLTSPSDSTNALIVAGSNQGSGLDASAAFTTAGSYSLTGAEMLVDSGVHVDNLNVFLYTDSGGLPGTEIEQIGFDLVAPAKPGMVTADSIATPLILASGTEYWLVLGPASADTSINWFNGGSSAQPAALSLNGAPFVSEGNFTAQFQINGAPIISSVPEPSSWWLAGAIAAVFCAMRRPRPAALDLFGK